jgi:hypothetical protein
MRLKKIALVAANGRSATHVLPSYRGFALSTMNRALFSWARAAAFEQYLLAPASSSEYRVRADELAGRPRLVPDFC